MRAICIEFEPTRAVVRMEPSWLVRLFGARATVIELGRVKRPGSEISTCRYTPWVCPGSGRDLNSLHEREIIRHALDFREVAELPAAKARTA